MDAENVDNLSPGSHEPGMVEAKSKKKPLKLVPSVFRDNNNTEGGRVKGRCEVLRHRVAKCGTQPHVNCRVQSFGLIMGEFCERKLQWVKEMGLGDLIHLYGKSLPRGLCYWLMTKVDPVKKLFIPSPGKELLLHKNQVHWVLGTPYGPKQVPRTAEGDEMKCFIEQIYEKYGVTTKGKTRYISLAKVMQVVEGECLVEDEVEFKTAFLALALADVLCPTTCMRLAPPLLPALYVAKDAAFYDWSGLVLEKLMCSAKSFAMNFYRDGFAKGCGGCTYFLAIYYLDRLNRVPVQWGVYPRIKAWDESEVNEAKNEDKLDQLPATDYGKLEFLDVAYGEHHPRAARDTLGPQSLAAEVAKHLARQGEGIMENVEESVETLPKLQHGENRKRRKKGPADNSNPYLRMLAKRARVGSSMSGGDEAVCNPQLPCFATIEEHGSSGTRNMDGHGMGNVQADLVVGRSESGGGSSGVSERQSDSAVDKVVSGVVQNAYDAFVSPSSVYTWGGDSFSTHPNKFPSELLNSGGVTISDPTFEELLNSVSSHDHSMSYENVNNFDAPEMTENDHAQVGDIEQESEVIFDREACDAGGDQLFHDDCLNEDGRNVGAEFMATDRTNELTEHPDGKLHRSRPRRGTKPSATLKDKDFVVETVPRRNPNLKARLVKSILSLGAVVVEEKQRQPTDKTQEDSVIMMSGDLHATLSSCYSLVAATEKVLNENYVRVAASIYTNSWKRKFGDSSVRFMIGPDFAHAVITDGASGPPSEWNRCKVLATSYAKRFEGLPAERFHVVFVPILQAGRWWCAGFCVNTEEVWVIDPTEANPDEVHDGFLHNLSFGVDIFLHAVDRSWAMGTSACWGRMTVRMDVIEEWSGGRMLLAVKACADRYKAEIPAASSWLDECGWLLMDDLLGEFNDGRDRVKELLSHFEK